MAAKATMTAQPFLQHYISYVFVSCNCSFDGIDNHRSGYLGMARCFNVHERLPVQLRLSYLSSKKALAKISYTSEKSNL